MSSGGRNVVQMEGQRFGALVVLRRAPRTFRKAEWVCRCDCGTECVKVGNALRKNKVKTCGKAGCSWWNFQEPGQVKLHPREYSSWSSMLRRCQGLDAKSKRNYLDRGIVVCERWKFFNNFFADMGKRPTLRHTLDRYPNNDGNYEPGNCRWATKKQQAQNIRGNIYVTFRGERHKLSELIDELQLDPINVRARLKMGWTLLEAICLPVNKHKKKRKKRLTQRNTI